jgi:hypothetical protein
MVRDTHFFLDESKNVSLNHFAWQRVASNGAGLHYLILTGLVCSPFASPVLWECKTFACDGDQSERFTLQRIFKMQDDGRHWQGHSHPTGNPSGPILQLGYHIRSMGARFTPNDRTFLKITPRFQSTGSLKYHLSIYYAPIIMVQTVEPPA